MISVELALDKVVENTASAVSAALAVPECLNHFLSNDLISPINLPSFRNSAMDGYALLYNDLVEGTRSFTVIGEIQAGKTKQHQLQSGQAYRIFTGAPVPDNCDLVIMQEQAIKNDNQVEITAEQFKLNQNIRSIGEQVHAGEVAMQKGQFLNPAALGYLSSLGFDQINVSKMPSVALVSTGNELIQAGTPLQFGQIYESNSAAIIAELQSMGISRIEKKQLEDDYESTRAELDKLTADYDFVLVTGGISVGDYDYVGKALREIGTSEIFYKVNQKPGKPLFFGRRNACHVFALPGNPAAALNCCKIYVSTAIKTYLGSPASRPAYINLPIQGDYIKKGNRAQFLKAKVHRGTVEVLDGQSSNMMQTFALANAIIYIDASIDKINTGDLVPTLIY